MKKYVYAKVESIDYDSYEWNEIFMPAEKCKSLLDIYKWLLKHPQDSTYDWRTDDTIGVYWFNSLVGKITDYVIE